MDDDLNDIPRHFIEEFRKAGPELTAWQIRAGGLPGVKHGYAIRWLAHLEQAGKTARKRYDRRMYYLAVATAVLAFIAVVEGGVLLALSASPPVRADTHRG